MPNKKTQIKFTVDADIVAAFKARCATDGVSMTSAASQWMAAWQPTKCVAQKALTRSKRRVAVMKVIAQLDGILELEEQYRDSIPEQFTQRHEWSDHACEHLAEAIDNLREAFAP